jgi:hypothetical protein
MPAPLADVARVAAEDFRRAHPDAVSPQLARELGSTIELALLSAVRAERRACAAECERRAELWHRTEDKPGVTDPVRLEAQHRANEAQYLADLIATRALG